MFGFLFKLIVLPLIVLLAAATGIAAYQLLTPVSETNVQSRLWQACMLTSVLQRVNNYRRPSPRPVYSSDQCTCAGDTVVTAMGRGDAATGADAARIFILDGINVWWDGGKNRQLQNFPTAQTAEHFVKSSAMLSRQCLPQS